MLTLLAWLALASPEWHAPVGSLVVKTVWRPDAPADFPVKIGDQLVSVDGVSPSSTVELALREKNQNYSKDVRLVLMRNGARVECAVRQFWRVRFEPVLDQQSLELIAKHRELLSDASPPAGAEWKQPLLELCSWAQRQPLTIRAWFLQRLRNKAASLDEWNRLDLLAKSNDYLWIYLYDEGSWWGFALVDKTFADRLAAVVSKARRMALSYTSAAIRGTIPLFVAYTQGVEAALTKCDDALQAAAALDHSDQNAADLYLSTINLYVQLLVLADNWPKIRSLAELGLELAKGMGSDSAARACELMVLAAKYKTSQSQSEFEGLEQEVSQQVNAYDEYSDLSTLASDVYFRDSVSRGSSERARLLLKLLIERSTAENRDNVSSLRYDRMFGTFELARLEYSVGNFVSAEKLAAQLAVADGTNDFPDYQVERMILDGDLALANGRLKDAESSYRRAQERMSKSTFADPRNRKELQLRLAGKYQPVKSRSVSAAPGSSPSLLTMSDGQGYAVLFATEEYRDWPRLFNPISDAAALKEELEDLYGFKVRVIANATKDRIFEVLAELAAQKFEPQDQLLVFFAGHGLYESNLFRDGMIVCADSKKVDPSRSSYLTRDNLTRILDNVSCGHVCLMLDVCFGGGFSKQIERERVGTRGVDDKPSPADEERLRKSVRYVTRKFLASGADQPVSDGVPGRHSPFVRKLLEVFRTLGMSKPVLSFEDLLGPVMQIQGQTPVYMDFGSFDPGSSFFFIRKRPEHIPALQVTSNLATSRRPG